MKNLILVLVFVLAGFVGAYAQPRLMNKQPTNDPTVLANVSYTARYEGGLFGYSKKEEGTLKFDDNNLRLIFYSKANKEMFSIPYKEIAFIYPQTQSSQSTTGKVVQNVPLPGAGIAGAFMKDKRRFMTISFDDPDRGTKEQANFKLDTAEQLAALIQTLGVKAEMQQRGDAYYRPAKPQYPANNQ